MLKNEDLIIGNSIFLYFQSGYSLEQVIMDAMQKFTTPQELGEVYSMFGLDYNGCVQYIKRKVEQRLGIKEEL